MYGGFIGTSPALAGIIQVQNFSQLEFLVKESEVVTGKPGRSFFVEGQARSYYQIRLDPLGYTVVEIMAGEDLPQSSLCPLEQLNGHLSEAMRCGRLFTQSLPN